MKTISIITLAALALTLTAPSVAADPPAPRKVTVNGTAIIHVVPDQMDWTIQVSFNGSSIPRAKARHDESLDAVLKYLKGLGAGIKDLQTDGISFYKDYYPGDDADRRRNPYFCTTQITFTMVDFSKYAATADALSQIDGVQVQSDNYSSSTEAQTRHEALKRAVLDAHDKADDLATTAGCTLDKPLSIEEQEAYYVRPEMMNSVAPNSTDGGSTPGAVAGRIDISARVVVSYELIPK
jgi:uncharacterized protein YggE